MTRREGQRVEVVPRRLDLPAVDDAVAEAEEDVLHLAAYLRNRVEVTARPAADRQRDVDALLGQTAVEVGAGELRLTRVERRLELLANGVQRHPRLAVADVSQRLLEGALATEKLDARSLNRIHRARRRRGGESFAFERLRVHAARGYRRGDPAGALESCEGWPCTTRLPACTTRGAAR